MMRRIEAICREEMASIGAQEVSFPALLASDPYKETGRWVEYGDNLFRLKDRKGVDMLLGPTHEEMFTLMVKDLYSSYKDLHCASIRFRTSIATRLVRVPASCAVVSSS
ncbi:prolyl-tRNA synthetase [Cutibacterium acnes JCM 18918]|nr:prolyl-tRNA synthetase [Cutibacterium acnes JCM 18918]